MAVYYAGFIPVDGVYAVLFPDLPGCNSQGDSLEEAFSMAAEALAGYLECLADDGDPIPIPSSRAEAMVKLHEQAARLDMGDLPKGTELHPVLAPQLDAQIKKIAVSFSQYKLEMIDRKARAAGMTRSGFLAAAASVYEGQQHA
ncbi:MAG: type II toxin-antitoxin system HicB family antitoxin [Desulfovibrio sp.]|uniref:type II toxin-antitoxin system HicB family antitoxin n=1 Tax=Desulfovibrio sp. TaxID=885 RepID=UPI0025C19B30|nr:type II toxin-antitoxin system HicB family antitoxin [Desulfovibrio sp.]MBS6829194.1 type II toxin-antitoxin system HicB family antitoxin [Desulfovibrio sp.]